MSGHERERLSAYLDRELPPGEQAAVETHLAACPECAAFLAELAAVDEAAASLPAEAPEGYFEAFPARVRSRLEARKAPARRVPAWTWAAAAALLLAVVTPLTVRQLRPSSGAAPSVAPAATQPAPAKAPSMAAEESRRPEPTPTAPPARTTSPEKRGPVPAAAPVAVPAAPEAPVAAPLPREAEGIFAHEPAAPPAVGDVAREAEANREKGVRDRLHPAAARAAVEAPDVQEQEDAFRRLESVRPRSAAEWRRLRDEWNAVAAVETDALRADEARVRAIVAAREAWRAGGDETDEGAFRRDAAAYLQRGDALQKPRVERLLAETRRTP
jgi:anti-sigma factor RsiW